MKLIDKDKIAAELEKRRKSNSKNKLNLAAAFEDNYLLSFLDAIDVKEVDLEQEIKGILNQYYYFPEEAIDTPTVIRITAKHFFELGLNAREENKL